MLSSKALLGVGGLLALLAAISIAGLLAILGFPLPVQSRRIGRVDGLRGYLALSVMIHHFVIWIPVARAGRAWEAPDSSLLNELGRGAVALFFMATGLVFYPRVLAGLRATAWPAVAITRLFRIMPLVVVSVLLVLLLIALRTSHFLDADLPSAVLCWISTWSEPPLLSYPDSGRLNAYVLWSLWYEWVFYIVVLPACALARDVTRGRLPSWAVPVGMLLGSRIAMHVSAAMIFPYLSMFAAGMIAFELHRRPALARLLQSRGAAIIATMALITTAVHYHEPFATAPLLAFGFFFACVACGNDLFGFLATRSALVLGECSFGIYLLHGLWLSLFFTDLRGATVEVATECLPIFLPVITVAVVFAAALGYLLVERPMIWRGAALTRLWTRRRLRPSAPELEVAP